jgi:hypothetical protein
MGVAFRRRGVNLAGDGRALNGRDHDRKMTWEYKKYYAILSLIS